MAIESTPMLYFTMCIVQRIPLPEWARPLLADQLPRDARLLRNALLVALICVMASSGGIQALLEQRRIRGEYNDFEQEVLTLH